MKAKTKINPLWGPKNRHAGVTRSEPIKRGTHGGPRAGSGRPRKDKSHWGTITCVLRIDTIEKLRDGAASKEGAPGKHFGDFLQWHLDRYPLPSREEYLALRDGLPLYVEIAPFADGSHGRSRKRRKVPLLISAGRGRVRAPRIRRPKLSKKQFTQAIVAAE